MLETDQQLSRAVVLYLGLGVVSAPIPDANRLIKEFGPKLGMEFATSVSALIDEVRKTPVDWSVDTLESASKRARDETQRRHPSLSKDAVRALEWMFAWDWR